MDYELAKSLKDAGFPQGKTPMYDLDGDWIPPVYRKYKPSLSELIDACGMGFVSVYNSGNEWDINEEAGSDVPQVSGKSFEEAVARLWLVLNPKKDE